MTRPYGAFRERAKRRIGVIALFSLALCAVALPARARPIRLLAFGDSLTAGYGLPHDEGFEAQLGDALAKAGHDVTILDGGVSGDTSAGGRARLDWVLADKPDAAIVELGANDGLRGTAPTELAANLGRTYGDAFRAVYDALGKRAGVLYDPFFLAGVAGDQALNQADGMHPNAAGVKVIVARLLPLVEKLIAEVPQGQDRPGADRAPIPGR